MNLQIKFKSESGYTKQGVIDEILSPIIGAIADKFDYKEGITTGSEKVIILTLVSDE